MNCKHLRMCWYGALHFVAIQNKYEFSRLSHANGFYFIVNGTITAIENRNAQTESLLVLQGTDDLLRLFRAYGIKWESPISEELGLLLFYGVLSVYVCAPAATVHTCTVGKRTTNLHCTSVYRTYFPCRALIKKNQTGECWCQFIVHRRLVMFSFLDWCVSVCFWNVSVWNEIVFTCEFYR